jgi:hypothetical protein
MRMVDCLDRCLSLVSCWILNTVLRSDLDFWESAGRYDRCVLCSCVEVDLRV